MTVTRRSRNGQDIYFRLDINAIVEYENAHPEWSIMDDITGLANKVRLSTLDRLCGFMGYSYSEFIGMGFRMDDLAGIFGEVLVEDLGFPTPESSETGSIA